MWAEMLLEPPEPLPVVELIYSQAIDDAIEQLEMTQKKGVYNEQRMSHAWLALHTLKKAKEKTNALTQD
jgi:hypothetical protein